MLKVSALLVLVYFSLSCQAQCLTENDNAVPLKPEAAKLLTDARFGFALEAMKKMIEIDSKENVFFSPHSIYEALSLVYFGARKHTELSLKKALHIPKDLTKADVQKFYAMEKAMLEARKVITRFIKMFKFSFENIYY